MSNLPHKAFRSPAFINGQQVVPSYHVEKLEGTRKKTVHEYSNNKRITKEIDIPAGYMVYFPRGHSIRLSEEELKEHGFDVPADLVVMDDELDKVKAGKK